MGIVLEEKNVTQKKTRRCCAIQITAPYKQMQTISQVYETVIENDGEYDKSIDIENTGERPVIDFFSVSIVVDGVTITGEQVAKFFLIYNDLPSNK